MFELLYNETQEPKEFSTKVGKLYTSMSPESFLRVNTESQSFFG